MNTKTLRSTPIVGGLLAAGLLFISASGHAENPVGKAIVESCKDYVQNPPEGADFDTECQAKCVSLNHVCVDEKTGEFVEPITVGCQRQIDQLLEACQVP